jgi:uncharacterized membrane protein YagU involved in acid resistance
MDVISAIIAGLVGTLVMTILMYLAPMMGIPKMDIIGMLGTMFTPNESTEKFIGAVIHFMMGAIFAIVYAFLWSIGIGSPTWWWGLIFGAVHAVITMVAIPLMNRMHPRPPEMESDPKMTIGLLMGHMVYGLALALTYGALI